MDSEFENQCLEQEENEEYEETESSSVQEKNNDGETTKQLSPRESDEAIFNYQVEEIQYVGDSQTLRTVKYNVVLIKDMELEWRKNVKRCHSRTKVTYSTWKDTEEKRMYEMVCDAFYRIVDLAAENFERCNHLVGTFKKLELEWDTNDKGCSKNISTNKQSERSEGKKPSNLSSTILSPIKKRCKGRPPVKRKQSKVDTIVKNLRKKPKTGGKKNCKKTNLIDLNVPSEELMSYLPNGGIMQDDNDAEVRELVPDETFKSAIEETSAQDL
ncbi:hypothetical protein ACET3Z_028102 [Daucus carota]